MIAAKLNLPHTKALCLLTCLILLSGCAGTSNNAAHQKSSFSLPHTIAIDPLQRQEVIMTALGLLDTPYRYGGAHPSLGFDCSGLVGYVFDSATAHTLPRSTADIARISRPVQKTQLKAGDLVFFNTLNRPNSHLGIYLGDGNFINAPSSGGRVRIDSLNNPWFAKRLDSTRTLFK